MLILLIIITLYICTQSTTHQTNLFPIEDKPNTSEKSRHYSYNT